MKLLRTAIFALLFASLLAFATSAGAALVGVYRNTMDNKGQLAQISKLSGERCARGSSADGFTITIGKATKECSYRTPVLGSDLEIAATMRLLSRPQVPMSVQRSACLAVELRAAGGARHQVAGTGGADKATQLRLRAFNVTAADEKGTCQLLACVGGTLIAEVGDAATGELSGRASGFSLGSSK